MFFPSLPCSRTLWLSQCPASSTHPCSAPKLSVPNHLQGGFVCEEWQADSDWAAHSLLCRNRHWHLGHQNPRPINPLFLLQSNSVEDKELKLFMTYIPRLISLFPTNLYKSPDETVVWLKLWRWKKCESVWPWSLVPLVAIEELHSIFFSPYFIFQKRALQQEKCEKQMEKVRFPCPWGDKIQQSQSDPG